MRASERMALEEANEDVEEVPLQREKTRVFGKMQQRRKVLVDEGVEGEMDTDWVEAGGYEHLRSAKFD